jgi:hypothetical protein
MAGSDVMKINFEGFGCALCNPLRVWFVEAMLVTLESLS